MITNSFLCQAQKHQLRFHMTGTNILNTHTRFSQKVSNLRTQYTYGYSSGFEYLYKIKESKTKLYFSLNFAENGSDVRLAQFKVDPSENLRFGGGRGRGSSAWGLGFGVNRNAIFKNFIDVTIGGYLRHLTYGNSTSRSTGSIFCNTTTCNSLFMFTSYKLSGKDDIHASIFGKLDFRLFKNKQNRHLLYFNLIYNQGLHKIFVATHYLKNVITSQEYLANVVNRGSYFGIGISYGLGTNSAKFKEMFKRKRSFEERGRRYYQKKAIKANNSLL